MSIGFRTSTSFDVASAGATQAVTRPSGAISTDILIAAIAGGSGSTPPSYSTPAGWTAVGSLLNQANGSDHIGLQVFWAPGDVAGLTFTKSTGNGTVGGVVLAFTGCDTTTPIDATGTPNAATTNVATLTTNALTIATDQAWHCIAFTDWLGGLFSATGFTNAENAAANNSAALLYNQTPKSVGSTGTVVVTSSAGTTGQAMIGVPFALRPAAGGGAAFYPKPPYLVRQAVKRAAYF